MVALAIFGQSFTSDKIMPQGRGLNLSLICSPFTW